MGWGGRGLKNRVWRGRGSGLYIEGWNRGGCNSERVVVEEIGLEHARSLEVSMVAPAHRSG